MAIPNATGRVAWINSRCAGVTLERHGNYSGPILETAILPRAAISSDTWDALVRAHQDPTGWARVSGSLTPPASSDPNGDYLFVDQPQVVVRPARAAPDPRLGAPLSFEVLLTP